MNSNKILKTLDDFFPNPKCPLNYEKDYELLLAVMLSAQSTDARVNIVSKELFKHDIYELANMDLDKIEAIIKPVGTQKRKAKYIKEICRILIDRHEGKVPNDRDFIEGLPGIGHKTCNVFLSEIYGEDAIAVDTHVSRVSKRLGFASEDADVIEIEQKLMEKFPKRVWRKLHIQLVLFGRHHCTAKKPLCETCPFKNTQCKRPQI